MKVRVRLQRAIFSRAIQDSALLTMPPTQGMNENFSQHRALLDVEPNMSYAFVGKDT
jgi:hypothetical protein